MISMKIVVCNADKTEGYSVYRLLLLNYKLKG